MVSKFEDAIQPLGTKLIAWGASRRSRAGPDGGRSLMGMRTMPSTSANQDHLLPTLEKRFSGEVIRRSNPRYERARALWNAIADRRPELIVRPRTSRDVATAIVTARDADLEIAIRCGGHSLPGHSMAEGGITIDLSAMNAVEVDPAAATARIGGGALLNDVGVATAPHALAMPFGHVSHTGVGGLTLGGASVG